MRKLLALVFVLLPTLATAGPMPAAFPKDRSTSDLLKHCIAVDHANTLASLFGGKLANEVRTDGLRVGTNVKKALPSTWVLAEIGGVEAMKSAQKVGLSWDDNWRSLGRTYWSALHSKESAPYTVAKGQLLLDHFWECLGSWQQLSKLHGPIADPDEKHLVSLPKGVTN
jgi:hypothetical protein